jgi:carbamoyltransferase
LQSAKPKSVILGINTGHGDSSAALVVDGVLVAAAEEERFSRIKHDAAFPHAAALYCLSRAGVTAADVTTVALPGRPHGLPGMLARNALTSPVATLRRIGRVAGKARQSGLQEALQSLGVIGAAVHKVEHHRAHMLSTAVVIGPRDAVMLSLDGMGDGVSAAFGTWQDGQLRISRRVHYPQSLGYFYTAVTMFLGFPNYGDEFKVMGLSSMGKPRFMDTMRRLVVSDPKTLYRLDPVVFPLQFDARLLEIRERRPYVINLYDQAAMAAVFGMPARKPGTKVEDVHADIAASLQLRFEEIAGEVLQELSRAHNGQVLGLSGGCSHNSVWVGKIPAHSQFTDVTVAPASGDAGLAIGAAVDAAGTAVRIDAQHPALLGPDHTEVRARKFAAGDPRFSVQPVADDTQLLTWLTGELCREKVIGIFRGRMEFGPRALGSRSIICDPRSAAMRDQLNARVKHREAFRPFAAFVMWEHQQEWFEHSFYAPTMEAVFKVRPEKRGRIPAVVHYDDSCRIQSVRKDVQPFVWSMLQAFYQQTGVPLLINTSFNDSEPVVCSEDDALSCFLHCDMDHIVFDNRIVSKTVG